MLKDIRKIISYILILIPAALKSATENKTVFWSLGFFMFLQNVIFFMIWVIYFDNFSNLKGWKLEDVATLYGLAAYSFGLAFLLCGGAQDLGRSIIDGEIDTHMGRPRPPLVGLLFKESRPSGWGDILTALLMWGYFGKYGFYEIIVLLILGFFSALIVLATTIIINCIPFYSAQTSRITDQLLESFIIISTYPHNGFGKIIKIILLTILPAGFVAYIPIEAIRNFDVLQMAFLAAAAVFYMCLSFYIFNRGPTRYTSGNKVMSFR